MGTYYNRPAGNVFNRASGTRSSATQHQLKINLKSTKNQLKINSKSTRLHITWGSYRGPTSGDGVPYDMRPTSICLHTGTYTAPTTRHTTSRTMPSLVTSMDQTMVAWKLHTAQHTAQYTAPSDESYDIAQCPGHHGGYGLELHSRLAC